MSARGESGRLVALGLLAVVVGALTAWLWAGLIAADQRQERSDLDLFLDASSAGWAEVTNQFFDVPEVAAESIGALATNMETTEQRLQLLVESMRRPQALDAAYIGYPDGSFVFVGRSKEVALDGFRTRTIAVDGASRSVDLTWTDTDLQPLRSQVDDNDDYDPRTRPWYLPIQGGSDGHWTAPYVFSSSRQPGITHSSAVRDDNGELLAVVGIDIRLDEFNGFLERLSPGENGSALVVDVGGRVIAESSSEVDASLRADGDGEIRLEQSPELLALVERAIADPSRAVRERSMDRSRTTIVRPAGARAEWYLAVQALDDDFLSTERASNAFSVFAVGVTAAALVGAAGYLVLRYVLGLRRQADIDELTGLFNRRAVSRLLTSLIARSSASVRVAIIDLDGFKPINDTYGHPAGDTTLRTIARRLADFARHHGLTAGRLGGDEFVLFGTESNPPWETLIEQLSRPVLHESATMQVTASIGVAESQPDGSEIADFLRAADQQLFEAKRSGGDAVRTTSSMAL